jgi:hypothetical protein
MPSYLDALKLVVDKNYEKAVTKLEDTLHTYESENTPNTKMSIFLLMKMASINRISGLESENEDVFSRVIQTAPLVYGD